MTTQTLTKIKPLHAELIPPQGARMQGTTPEGRQLYAESIQRSRSIPLLDEDGDRKLKQARAEFEAGSEKLASAEATIVREHQQWRRHRVTGEPMYALRRSERYTLERLYLLESDGQGNVGRVEYHRPTAKELAEVERQARITAMGGGALAEELVNAEITPAEMVAAVRAMRGAKAPIPTPVPVPVPAPAVVAAPAAEARPSQEAILREALGATSTPTAQESVYPMKQKGGVWLLSTGEKVGPCKQEKAIEAEKDAQERAAKAKAAAAETPEE